MVGWERGVCVCDSWVCTCVTPVCVCVTLVSSSRPLFKDASGTLDKSARFSALYRQDGNKLSNDDVFKLLADFRKLVSPRSFVFL